MEEERDVETDHPLQELAAGLVWRFTKLALRFLWNLALAIFASICAGLILLVGVSAILGFGMLGVALVLLLIKTAITPVVGFVLSIIVAMGVILVVVRTAALLASRRISISGPWRWARSPLRRLRMIVVRVRSYSRTEPQSEQLAALAGLIFLLATVLLIAYLEIWGLESWNQVRGARLPARIPVEQVGRSSMPQILTVADAAKYTHARRERVAAMKRTMAQSNRSGDPLLSRCGSVSALLPAETEQIAELLVDLTGSPPVIKREYVITEDQLTFALSTLLKSRTASVSLDCVKVHRDGIKLFTTTVDSNGVKQNQALGVSIAKAGGRLRIVLEELAIGRGSFQLGWLGLGATGDRTSFLSDDKASEELEGALRALDSRIFRITANEGYMRIVTWRLPSVLAARAAERAGQVRTPVEHRVEPKEAAASLGMVSVSDLVYVLETTERWLYACSEVSGRCGWLPADAFLGLQDDR